MNFDDHKEVFYDDFDLQGEDCSLQVDTSLEILEVRPDDAGTYFCNVETYGEPLDQAHTLDVLVPPSVQV